MSRNLLLLTLAIVVVAAFSLLKTMTPKVTVPIAPPPAPPSPAFAAYWPLHKTELSYYRLNQAQDGAIHKGQATLAFTSDTTSLEKSGSFPAFLTNLSRTFRVGRNDYSLLTSVSTPINNPSFPRSLQVVSTEQSWTGQRVIQLIRQDGGYQISTDSTGAINKGYTVDDAVLEDEIWSQIRVDPAKLPVGKVTLLSGSLTAQLRRRRLMPMLAQTSLTDYEGVLYPGEYLQAYTIRYPTNDRTLTIVFERLFPHRIMGWEEIYQSRDNLLTTRAVLQKTVQTDFQQSDPSVDSTLYRAPFK
ncbi:hypothetical protein [Spirosoma sp. KUDC1026]|uniref:hypothetical protein n=1 Tax=Spirosoma sp. KUDC1026 TaxID=2745947 RepID=UPI00159BCB0B|nr:hypothetical protein [Spirosoma sp. KUDC1026]QKZ11545.1 hypothetical protein HU175_02420 [Spirosoma sp. KUDC1026]